MPHTDKFKPKAGDPLTGEHQVVSELFREYKETYLPSFMDLKVEKKKAGRQILDSDREQQSRYAAALITRLIPLEERMEKLRSRHKYDPNIHFEKGWDAIRDPQSILIEMLRALLKRSLPLSEEVLTSLLKWLCIPKSLYIYWYPLPGTVQNLEHFCASHVLSSNLAKGVQVFIKKVKKDVREREGHKLVARLQKLSGTLPKLPIFPGEAWSDAAIAELKSMSPPLQAAWAHLLAHCEANSGSSPSAAWSKKADEFLSALKWPQFKKTILRWFPLVNLPRTQRIAKWYKEFQPDPNHLIIEPHSNLLKGLVWVCGMREDKEVARALTALALSTYRKIPLKGPREVKTGNACVIALGLMPGMEGVGQLALLKVRVKFGTAQKTIEKALEATAKRVGLPREELEEMAVPAYGLTKVGSYIEKIGDYTAELAVVGSDSTSISWIKSDGKQQQSIPVIVKEKFAADLKELQSAAKDIQRMLPAQRERIDNLFREQKQWPFETWRERYLDHPLVGVLARRLIWEFTGGKRSTAGIFFNGVMVDLDLKPIMKLDGNATVQLWHPIGKDADEVVAWRAWLDAQQIQQPFKQAHREVYVLTDAERNSGTYSNRFAAHVLRQHQFNALCAARGWKNKLRLLVDAEFPPATVYLPKWNLRAEFWIEGIGEDHGVDTSDSGVFLRLSTDQVRFYRMEAAQRTAHAGGGGYHPDRRHPADEPPPLTEIPPLVFSEVMRDVDLFVGVASVGNDPTWSDGGPDGRYRDYWQNYSFGDLNASAKTRLEVLQRLVPRLKIAGQCSFQDKFLLVRGSVRTYKIHLGSGNILMEPNDQYLCIVPKQTVAKEESVLLPFEGDRTLSVILSKAFLLAEDSKIKDSSILSQIKR